MYGVDIVMMADKLPKGRRDATIPPIEWPMTMILVSGGYNERIYETTLEV